MGGEIRNPRRTVPRAAWISGLGIAGFYILGTLALTRAAPARPDQHSDRAGGGWDGGGRSLGLAGLGLRLPIFLVLAGVAGQLGAWIGGSARIPFVIGLDHRLPAAFARIHPRWHTPHWCILLQGLVCTLFLLALQAGEDLRIAYQLLVDMTVITYFIPFLYLFGASWKHGLRWSAAQAWLVTAMSIGGVTGSSFGRGICLAIRGQTGGRLRSAQAGSVPPR